MGSDLILHTIWIDARKIPDWAAAEAALLGMTDEQTNLLESSEYSEADTPALYRQALIADLREVRDFWNTEHRRDAYVDTLGPIKCLLAGGMSWGDDPSEFFSIAGRLLESDAFEVAGFFTWPSPTKRCDQSFMAGAECVLAEGHSGSHRSNE